MNNRGFSVVELVVVVALIATLLTIATLDFGSWQKKYNIEGQVKEMLVDLTDVRLRAIETKKQHTVILNPTSYTFRRFSSEYDVAGTQVFAKTLKIPIQQFSSGSYSAFSNTTITISDRGYSNTLLTIAVGAGMGDSAYNCIGFHTARANMGKINGNNCEYK